MTRRITIELSGNLDEPTYSDLANAVWMVMRVTGRDFKVVPDSRSELDVLNGQWEQYGLDAQWVED